MLLASYSGSSAADPRLFHLLVAQVFSVELSGASLLTFLFNSTMPDFINHVANLQLQITQEANAIIAKTDARVDECLAFLRNTLVVASQPKQRKTTTWAKTASPMRMAASSTGNMAIDLADAAIMEEYGFNKQCLEEQTFRRRQLQHICKGLGIKANGKTHLLYSQLMEKYEVGIVVVCWLVG